MGLEEQEEEREVLASIYPDEIKEISETEFQIAIALDIENADDEVDQSPTILLSVSYPPTYPSVAPNLDLLAAPDSPRHPHLDLSTDKPTLLSLLSPIIEENLGMAMIFTLVTSLKESAEQLIAERKGAEAAAREREMEKAEEEENRKFVGQMVTKESFLRWRDGFRLEMEERRRLEEERIAAERKKGAGAKEDVGKLTGRQIWERGLQGRGDEEDDVLDGMEKLKLEVV